LRSSKTLTSTQIFDLLRDDLQKVEEEFGQQTVSNVPKITEIGQYLQAGGGKRLRPAWSAGSNCAVPAAWR
jgi:geranylgeranyl pyrophosphate synthase